MNWPSLSEKNVRSGRPTEMTARHNCDYLSLVAIRLRLKTTSEVEERV
jgi:hypothetical protein